MNLFRYTHTYGSAYSLEELQAILRFDKIGSGNYFHCLDAETEDGYVLAPKMNLPAKNNFAPVVTASLHEAEQEEKITLHFRPTRDWLVFGILVFLLCILVLAITFKDIICNPSLLLIYPLIVLFFFLLFLIGYRLTYRDCLKKFVKQLKLYPIQTSPKEN